MPLKPSGQTPTSSPPRSIRSASSLQARVAPPLRASVLTTGILKTRSAPSGRRNRPVWSWIDHHRHQAVDRDGAGVVGDDQRAALGRDVLDAADLDPEPLLRDRAQRGHEEPLGDLLVEAVLVDDVVAGHPAAQEGQEPGQLRLPLVAEQLAGGVLERRQPVAGRDAAGGQPAPRCTPGRGSPRGRARPAARRPARSVRLGGRRRSRRSAAAAGLRGGGLAGAGGEAARGRGRLAAALAAAGAAAGADRDDLGVTHGGHLRGAGAAGSSTGGSWSASGAEHPLDPAAGRASGPRRSRRTPPRW